MNGNWCFWECDATLCSMRPSFFTDRRCIFRDYVRQNGKRCRSAIWKTVSRPLWCTELPFRREWKFWKRLVYSERETWSTVSQNLVASRTYTSGETYQLNFESLTGSQPAHHRWIQVWTVRATGEIQRRDAICFSQLTLGRNLIQRSKNRIGVHCTVPFFLLLSTF